MSQEALSEAQQMAQLGKQALAESFNFFDSLNSGLFGCDEKGDFWNPIQGGTGPFPPQANYLLVVLQSPLFNRLQRWLARYLYHTNAYAISAVDSLTDIVLGPGYEIVAESDANQRRIDEWVEANNWDERVIQAYKSYLVDGEVFFRVFDQKVRFVDPDFVFSDQQGASNGVKTVTDDYETVEGYYVSSAHPWQGGGDGKQDLVSVKEMQHRKMAMSYEPRGFSLLLAIYSQILKATQLLDDLCTTMNAQSRVAVIRQHDATKEATQAFRSGITNTLPNNQARNPNGEQGAARVDGIESYPPGSIVDNGVGTTWHMPSEGLQAAHYVEVLRAILRQVAARCGIPEALLSQDQDSLAAYTAALIPNSNMIRMAKSRQATWCKQDLKLLAMCGIPTKGVTVNFLSPVIIDKKEEKEICEFLLQNKIASKQTIAQNFDIDWDSEHAQIKKETEMEEVAGLTPPPGEAKNMGIAEEPGTAAA